MKSLLPIAGLALVACSGEAVIDFPAAGGGGAGGSSSRASSGAAGGPASGPSTSSGGTSCDSLYGTFRQALDEATLCNPCIDNDACIDGPQIHDECSCVVGASNDKPDAAKAAEDAYDAWIAAGCGPVDCARPCAVTDSWTCGPVKNGGCEVGRCQPLPGG
jgi:hypothetical protein